MLSLKNIDINKLTPMMKQYYKIKKDTLDFILFYRLGDFYEMFFDDALIASKVLGLALTGRDCGLDERAPMCGIPFHSATQYIKNLIDNGYKIAICEQLESPQPGKGIVERGIVKVFTPGTILDYDYLNGNENNFISSIYLYEDNISLAFCDISTGELFLNENINKNNNIEIISEINKFEPNEVILNNKELYNILKSENKNLIYLENHDLKNNFELMNLTKDIIGIKNYNNCNISSINSLFYLFEYLIDNKNTKLNHINKIIFLNKNEFMGLDENTHKNLELCKSLNDGTKKGTLFSVLDKTITSKGSRMLKSLIERPLIDIGLINKRLDLVEAFFNEPIKTDMIRELLEYISDIERINSKIVTKIASPRDLVNLKNTLKVIPNIKNKLNDFNNNLPNTICLDFNNNVYELINSSIVDEPPNSTSDGNFIKKGCNEELDKVKDTYLHSENLLLDYENSLKIETGIKNIRVKYNKVTGYFIEISKGQIENAPDYFKRIQTLKNVERYTSSELAQIEYKILNSSKEALEIEKLLYDEILNKIINYIDKLNDLAQNLALLDCFISFAEVARLNNYIRPNFNNKGITDLKSCRHPVVELNSSLEAFIPNDAYFDNNQRYAIITGPNMSGKSTYMRTIALNQILAQIGSFVPANEANLSIIDNIFTRIGASDSLNSGKSTFMVEMSEVSYILNNSTSKSLILLDEVGRGTSTYDGMSIALAVIEYIVNNIKAKTLFSTHYHELSELENKFYGVFNLTLEIKEKNDKILFLRKVIYGITNKSYGIHVAKLAGLPDKLINLAENYQNYFSNILNEKKSIQIDFLNSNSNSSSKSIMEESIDNNYRNVINKIKEKDLNKISPIDALNFLYKIKGELDE